MTSPSADAFAALARSSPWLWWSARFTARWSGARAIWSEPLRAWLRRPDLLRVETLDGRLVQVVRETPQLVGLLTAEGGRTAALPWPGAPEVPAPAVRDDGLVARRPEHVSFDAPMFQSYFWVAMLDPVELADARDPESAARVPGLVVEQVADVEHSGRPAWEAIVRTTPAYEPRCGCCSLLRSRAVDLLEYGPAGLREEYPEAHRVRLDVGTGICVLTEELGGSNAGEGHELRIEAVDEPMLDELFAGRGRGQ